MRHPSLAWPAPPSRSRDRQPPTDPKYQLANPISRSSALLETTNRVLQLVENTLVALLITQRSLVQIQPPRPNLSTTYKIWPAPVSPCYPPIRNSCNL